MKRLTLPFAIVMTVTLCAMSALAVAAATRGTRAGQAAAPVSAKHPTLAVTTLAGGHFTLKAQRGKWVIINYWATWCSPCIKEMPALSAFVSTQHDVVAIGLAYEDKPASVLRAFLLKHPVHYPVAHIDPMHPPKGIAMPSVLPTTFLIAPDGHLAQTFIGPLDIHKLAAAIGDQAAGT